MNEWPVSAIRMRRQAAARYLGTSVGFLEKAAVRGDGPPYTRLSARLVIYDKPDLDAWMAVGRVGSTSDTAGEPTTPVRGALFPSPSPGTSKIADPPPQSGKRLRRQGAVARPQSTEVVTP
jgi:hypothetical protein